RRRPRGRHRRRGDRRGAALPRLSAEPPQRAAADSGRSARSDDGCAQILDLLPESRTRVYDMRKIIGAIVDRSSLFELKARFGRSVVTGFARLDGKPIGIIANNPFFKGGAIDVDACQKVTSALVMFDSFNLPTVILVDQPGFLIGVEGEMRG